MIAKRFAYVSVGILALAISFAVVSSVARGQANAFRVVGPGLVVSGETLYELDESNQPFGWKALPYGGWTLPPVPVSSIVNYEHGTSVITDTGEGWGLIFGTWTDLGPIPTTATVRTSWGQVKDKYRR